MKTTKTKWFASVSLTKLSLLATGMFLAATSSALATVRYVNVSSPNPTPPYTNWATAATDIQSAVAAAGAGDEIVVTNGVYAGGTGSPGPFGVWGNLGAVFRLTIVPNPQLTIIPAEPYVILTWPTDYGGFIYAGYTLQSTTNLVSPVWTPVSPGPVVIGGENVVINTISGRQQFFRLSQ